MSKINVVNNTLSSQTGDTFFVGSDSHSLTGDIDFTGADTVEIPNSAAPTVSSAGQIAIDTTITSYTALPLIHDGVEQLYNLSVPYTNLTAASDGYLVTYNSGALNLSAPPTIAGGKIVGFSYAASTTLDSTTSATYVSSSLTDSYTPTNASNLLLIEVYGLMEVQKTGGGNIAPRVGSVNLRRTTGTAANLVSSDIGRTMASSSASNLIQYLPFNLSYIETAGSTASHTYLLQFRQASGSTAVTVDLRGDIGALIMIIYELEV